MEFDTRWVTAPLMAILAIFVGDVSPWVVGLVFVCAFRVYFK